MGSSATTDRFDWTLVRSFLATLDHGTLLAAARHLGISQPTLGRHIAVMEQQLGVVLFERTGRGLVPTNAALKAVEAARGMQAQAELLSNTLNGVNAEKAGSVRITASTPVAVHLLPPILASMRTVLPDVQVDVISSNQVSNLLRREADIAIRMVRPQQGSLIARKIGDVSIGACAHRSYLERVTPVKKMADLLSHTLIDGDTDTQVLQGFKAYGFDVRRDAIGFRSDDLMVQWEAVRAGLGIGFMPHYMARLDKQVQPMLEHELRIPALPMWLAVHREIRSNQMFRAVFDFLGEGLRKALP
jgi:DNA-binding transcriptional LysR family regulator